MNLGRYNSKIYPYAEIRVIDSQSNIIFADSNVEITIFTPYLKFWAHYDDIVFMKDLNVIYEYNPFYNRKSSLYKEGNIFMIINNLNVIFLMNFSGNYNIAEWVVLYRKKSVYLTILTFSVLLKFKPFLEIKWKPFLQNDKYNKKEGKSIIISCEVKNYSTFNIEHIKFQYPSETLFQKTLHGQYLIKIFLTLMPIVVNKTLNCSFGPWNITDNSILQFPLNPVHEEIVVKEELMLSSLIVSGKK